MKEITTNRKKDTMTKEEKMTDQTRWGIDQVQQINKAKAYEDQKDMREELKKFVFNCNTFNLQKMYERMKDLNK